MKIGTAGRLGDRFELNNLQINEADLKGAFLARTRNGFTGTETRQRLSMTFETLHRLRDDGLLVLRRAKNATSRMTDFPVTPDSLTKFEKWHFSLGMLRSSDATYRNLRFIDLDRLKLKPILDDVGLRRIYRWRDLPNGPTKELEVLEVHRRTNIVLADLDLGCSKKHGGFPKSGPSQQVV